MANFYIISFDPEKTDSTGLHRIIKDSSTFISWWHYISSVYIVKTNENLAGVHAELQRKWPNNRYIIIKLDPQHRNGWLNHDAWEWFRKKVDE